MTLEWRLEQSCGANLALEPGTALHVALGRLKRPLGRPRDAKSALERCLAAPGTPENEVGAPWDLPRSECPASNLLIDESAPFHIHQQWRFADAAVW